MGLTFVRDTTWQEVFAAWEKRETKKWGWEPHYKEEGFDSWEAWRSQYIRPFSLDERLWKLYRVDDPMSFVPEMWAGGFKGWKRYVPEGTSMIRMKKLAKHSKLSENGKVQAILADPPSETVMIAFKLGEDFILFEGMHRAAAISLAAGRDELINMNLTLAVTEFGSDEQELFDKARTKIK